MHTIYFRTLARALKHESVIFLFVTILWLSLITGFSILLPINNSWLLNAGDLETHYLGWEFLRKEVFHLFPLGGIERLGSGSIPSIVYTDSIPIVAVPLNGILKILYNKFGLHFETLQFSGSWIALCVYLQYSGSVYCLRKLGVSSIASYAYGALFIICPFFLWRLPGLQGHLSLFSQWLILWSFYLYFCRKGGIFWILILATAFAIHAYCGAMVFGIFLSSLLSRLRKPEAMPGTIRLAGLAALVIALILWLLGYFELGGNIESGGYGTYKWNTLSWLNGTSGFSRLFGFWDYSNGEYEGFSYLGIATLFFLSSGLLCSTFRMRFRLLVHLHQSLVISSLLMCLFAMTLSIGFGVFQFPIAGLPPPFSMIGSVFRASGRFSWPMMYLIMLFAVSSWHTCTEKMVVGANRAVANLLITGAVIVLLFLQIADSSEALAKIRGATSKVSNIYIAKDYGSSSFDRVYSLTLYPSGNYYPNWSQWWRIALANNLEVNAGSFARYNILVANELDDAVDSMITKKKVGNNKLVVTEDTVAKSRIAASFKSCEEIGASDQMLDCYIELDTGSIALGHLGKNLQEYLRYQIK